jgi:hypothetical protein
MVTIITAPVFADQLFDTCSNLANERVGPITQSGRGHWQQFFRQCVAGKIPLPVAAVATRGHAPQGSDAGLSSGDEGGRILCVVGSNGQRYCR